jgi:hypothetical protein
MSDTRSEIAQLTAASQRRRERLLAQLPDLRQILRGSLVTRYRRCGRSNCHCARKGHPGHGPAYYLKVTIAPGETLQVYVPKEHRDVAQAFIRNYRLTQRKLEEISALNRALLKKGKLFKGG